MITNPGQTLKLLKDLTKQDILSCRLCKVKKVDKSKFTCSVSPVDSPDITLANILLSPSDKGHNVIIPEIDSIVIVSFLDKSHGYVSMFSKIDQHYQATNDESIRDILLDFIKAIKAIQLTHPQGPTMNNGVINVLDFVDIENRLKKFYLK